MVIRFTPIGAQMLLGVPMNLLTDRIVALEESLRIMSIWRGFRSNSDAVGAI